jgi:radical SAM protein with 4Fe4S-binding SPASM domain
MTANVKNRLKIWISSRRGDLTPDTYPNVIAVEPTNLCNLSCPMCPRTSLMKREKGLMNFSLFKKIVDESKGKTEFMYIDNMGDPLIHPKICEMVDYAGRKGIRMLLGTNAAFLSDKLAACLLKNGPDIIELSIDAATPQTYEKVRGGKNYDQVVKNVMSFSKAKQSTRSTKPFTILQFVRTAFNAEEEDAFYRKFKRAGYDFMAFRDCHTWGGNIPDYGVKNKTTSTHTENSGTTSSQTSRPCRILWNQLTVLWNGDVTPCFYDFDGKSVVGNLNKESLTEIWNSSEMANYRKYHVAGSYEKVTCCQNCRPMPPHGIRTFFGGMADSELFRILIWYFQCARNADSDRLVFNLKTKAKAYKEFLSISLKKSR